MGYKNGQLDSNLEAQDRHLETQEPPKCRPKAWKSLIEKNGGKISSSISSRTNYLVAGKNLGPAKFTKANSIGVPIINESTLIDLIS